MSIRPVRRGGIRGVLDAVDDSIANLGDHMDGLRHEEAEIVAEIANLNERLRLIQVEKGLISALAIGQQGQRDNILITHQRVTGA